MGHLAIFALGPLRIELDGQPLQTSRHKALALLVYLALNRDRQSREALSTFLWPEYSQEKAYAYLRRTLWEIRNLLGDGWLDADRGEVGLHPDASIMLDIVEFQSHLESINHHKHPITTICQECISHLRKAALLYRGDFLSGFSLRDSINFDDWRFFQGEALRRDYAEALQKLAYLFFQERLFSDAITFARRWLALDTLNEEAHRLLMKIYVWNGQRHAALRQYQECQRTLQTDLGIAPEPTTILLHEAIASGKYDPEDKIPSKVEGQLQKTFQAGSTADWLGVAISVKVNKMASSLPTPATPFIGRQQEVHQITTLLSDPDCWLLTLLGPGGIGKTRLAIDVGQKLIDQFPQGVFFVSLSMVQNEQSITPAIARVMGLVFRHNGPAPKEQLLDFLREKHLLIILDSFEGLVQWVNYLAQIHSIAAGVKLLVTSRHRLHLQGEWVLDVKGLEYPQGREEITDVVKSQAIRSYSAVELFLQAAHRAQVTFQMTPDDLIAISQITRLLEGMPLVLELAATWINMLSCPEIAIEISRGLDILESPLGDISERHRSIRAVFNYSWDLISSREQVLLPRLAVFRGSFSRQAAGQIAGITLRELSGLVDKSLVRRTANGRFDLHDLLHQYCAEKLEQVPGDYQETHSQHCAFFSTRLSQWNVELGSPLQGEALQEMEAELENLQAAWEWAVCQKQVARLEQAVDGLCMFYLRRARFSEGRDACRKAFEAIQSNPSLDNHMQQVRLSSRLLTWQAVLNLNLERFEEVGQLLQESQRILDDSHLDPHQVIQERIFMLVIRALFANQRFDTAAMLTDYEQSLQLSQKVNGKSPRFLIYIWRFLMGGSVTKELYVQMEKKLADVQQGSDPFELGCHLFVLGIGELYHNYRMDKAEPLLRESVKNFQAVEDPSTQSMIIKTLGYLLLVQGDFEENLILKRRELEIVQELGDRRMMGIVQAEIGEVCCHMGDYLRAEEHIRTAISLFQGRSDYEDALRHRYLGDVLLARGKFSEAREAYQFSYHFFQTKNEKGWMFTALTGLSRTEFALGNRPGAWQYIRQALHLYAEIQLYGFFVYPTVAAFALLLADQGGVIRALELYGMVLRQGYLAQSQWFSDLYGKVIETAAIDISLEEQSMAKERGQAFDLTRTIQLLLDSIPRFEPR